MIVNNNLSALNSYNRLKTNSKIEANHAARLASGKKINSAADDAAGLAISTTMKAQIRGLERASINVGEGISLIKIADGAMTEMTGIAQRMRELCVQAANDTNTIDDRDKVQNEIAQLTSELNKFTSDTNYNGIRLFDGSISGHYGYDYGLKTLPAKHTPAVVEAQNTFVAPLDVPFGTQATANAGTSYYASVDLNQFDTSLEFPQSGTFTITVSDPLRSTVTASLDFSVHNPSGNSFTLTDFENFFKDAFENPADGLGKIADFSIVSGKIQVKTEEKGGSGSRVSMSGTAYDSIIGSSRSSSSYAHYGLMSATEYSDLDTFWDSIKGSLAGQSNTFKLWGGAYQNGSIVDSVVYNQITINYSNYNTFSELQSALNSVGLTIFRDRTGNIGISPTQTSDNIYYPNGGYSTKYRKVSIEDGANALTNLFNNATSVSNNSSGSNNMNLSPPTSITSNYAINVSEYAGILTINVGGPNASGSCTIDFSQSLIFLNPPYAVPPVTDKNSQAAKDLMIKYINDELNKNAPNPPATNPVATAGYEVATALIDGSGRLVIQAKERGGYVSVSESYSDKPMYTTSNTTWGYDTTTQLSITDDFGNTNTIKINPTSPSYADLDEFIANNQSSFNRSGYTIRNDSGKLVITSIGEGKQFTLSNLTSNPASLLTGLGLVGAVLTDGTTRILTPDDPEYVYKGLLIQNGANAGNYLYISIPSLNAHDLGLTLFTADMQSASIYNGISQTGIANYDSVANVEGSTVNSPLEHGLKTLSHETAAQAISIVDNALNILNTERSTLGSIQNRLEAINISLGVTSVGLSDANSRIEDADMAKELMNKMKYSVLAQAGMSMLAQANSRFYDVVNLLKG